MNDVLEVMLLPLLAGLLVLASHVPLGRQVLRRGIIFIDLAVAQAAATGALFAAVLLEATAFGQQAAALAGAAGVTVLLHAFERVTPQRQEALIGAVFVVLTCAATLASASGHGHDRAHALLNGQLLWADAGMLAPLAGIAALTLAAARWARHALLRFYLPLALAVTVSVQVIGVYLVFASLIFPALGAGDGRRAGWLVAAVIGAAGYGTGLLASATMDLPSGPTVVLALGLAALVAGSVRCAFARRSAFRYNPAHEK